MNFRINTSEEFYRFLQNITQQQSRTLLIVGGIGWGKTACGLDLAYNILKTDPLASGDFFYFRNDLWGLKAEFFLNQDISQEISWIFLQLLYRRINISNIIDEHISPPAGIKLPSIKEQLGNHITSKQFPQDKQFISQLIQLAYTFQKKQGIPINIVRELTAFHSAHTNGRVSILGDFDHADHQTQNAILKLIEEPNPNHWVILTAQNKKTILPTILSRTLVLSLKKPKAQDFDFLGYTKEFTNTIDIMQEEIHHISSIKQKLIDEFFIQCSPNIEHKMTFISFAEKLSKENQSLLFLTELVKCFEDGLRKRHSYLHNTEIPILYPQYKEYSQLLYKSTTAELEEIVSEIETFRKHSLRNVIKDDYIFPKLLLDISRFLRKIH